VNLGGRGHRTQGPTPAHRRAHRSPGGWSTTARMWETGWTSQSVQGQRGRLAHRLYHRRLWDRHHGGQGRLAERRLPGAL